ncbi:MAG TPA: hypothetical protein VKR43_18080 [Bryobacteraceae bacterium]|nr:hypothetical protein [Bryobacteraceae bacterium]
MSRVYDVLAPFLSAGIAIALFVVLVFLVLGPFRYYWVVFAYAAWELIATVAFTVADLKYHGTAQVAKSARTLAQIWYARLYWANDVLVDLFRFVLVIVLIYRISTGKKQVSARTLTILVLIMMVLPFVLFHPRFNPWPAAAWFNSTSELLNFGAAIMNLMLWTALIASRNRDPQFLMVSAGLGVVVTGSALSLGVRHLISGASGGAAGYLLLNITQLIGWLIWCVAFKPVRRPAKAPSIDGMEKRDGSSVLHG